MLIAMFLLIFICKLGCIVCWQEGSERVPTGYCTRRSDVQFHIYSAFNFTTSLQVRETGEYAVNLKCISRFPRFYHCILITEGALLAYISQPHSAVLRGADFHAGRANIGVQLFSR